MPPLGLAPRHPVVKWRFLSIETVALQGLVGLTHIKWIRDSRSANFVGCCRTVIRMQKVNAYREVEVGVEVRCLIHIGPSNARVRTRLNDRSWPVVSVRRGRHKAAVGVERTCEWLLTVPVAERVQSAMKRQLFGATEWPVMAPWQLFKASIVRVSIAVLPPLSPGESQVDRSQVSESVFSRLLRAAASTASDSVDSRGESTSVE
jgi:hypothetical protein